MNECKLIKKCQSGDMKYFAGLYDEYFDKIYRFIYYKTMHRETAEDLTSRTFYKAMESLDKYNPKIGTFSSWLYCIARNNVIDHYRTKKQVDNIDGIWNLSAEDELESDIDIKNKLTQVKKYLDKISAEHREIVVMRLWDQLSYQEISAITGKTVNSCKMTFSRTMIKLREDLAFIATSLILIISNLIKL